MAFRKKADFILAYKPDILIVPECEHPDKLKFTAGLPKPNDTLWFGTNQNKGLGIFSYGNFKLTRITTHNPEFQMIVPVVVTNGNLDFSLYAVWAKQSNRRNYDEQIWQAIHYYDDNLTNKHTMLVGDFNSNTIWDKKHRESNHSNIVKRLEGKGIYSCYHSYYNQQHGKEQYPTLYMSRHKNRPYHIDYCFVSEDMLEKLLSVEVGNFDCWIPYSDHVPLIVTFNT
jgi:exodeoxyribonuclease III